MLDAKYIYDNINIVKTNLIERNDDVTLLDNYVSLYDQRREILLETENLQMMRNDKSRQIGEFVREKKDPSSIKEEVGNINNKLKKITVRLEDITNQINKILYVLPNISDKSVKVGKDSNDNELIKTYGVPRKFDFPVKDHVELGEQLDILDFESASKIIGTRFVVDKGLGARLERSLIQFMMDTHTFEHNRVEIIPPFIVNETSLFSTGQFPKFKEDVFEVNNQNWYLNPTAEVPTINLYRDEIIDTNLLPIKLTAFTTAFRSEAGSAGRDTRGILRQHQFNKVELITISKPEDSYKELDLMLAESEKILQLLEIPYRVVSLCTGDIGFAMAKTYDIEVWIPSQNTYREIGSISNAEDFQARRAKIRYRNQAGKKAELVHTLNGSGLAVGRTMIAVIENYQNEDGSITVPKVLRPYMRVDVIK